MGRTAVGGHFAMATASKKTPIAEVERGKESRKG